MRKLRTIQTIISIIIFLMMFIGCLHFTQFNITDIQLSYWGVENKLSIFWNTTLIMLSISMFFNVIHYIKEHKRIIYKNLLYILFTSVFMSLLLTGLIDMSYNIHNILAYYYFFLYPISIFLLSHLNRKTIIYKEWLGHLLLSIGMFISPIIFLQFFKGMAISEISHGIFVVYWNLWILNHE